MFARKTEGTDNSFLGGAAPNSNDGFGVTRGGHAFRPQAAAHADVYGGGAPSQAPHARARATFSHRGTLGLFRLGWGLRGHRTADAAARRVGSASEIPRESSMESSAGGSSGAVPTIPLPPRFLSPTRDTALAPMVLPPAHASGVAAHAAPARDAPWPGPRAPAWPQRLLSAVAYRLRYLAAPGEHRKALRLAHTREKVVGSAYVFLNAIQSDEPLLRHFAELRRQVRRLDRRAGVVSGISDESARVLLEAADRTAGARHLVRDKIQSFHREELLYDLVGADEFHRADAILLAVESRMATGIALYGDALRCLAATDIAQDAACESIGQILETVFAREAAAGAIQRRDWLASAVGRLPYRTLVRLHAVLSAGLACGGAYQAFLDELLRIVEAKVGIPPRGSAADIHAGAAGG